MGDTLIMPIGDGKPVLPGFKAGERVHFYPTVTGGIIPVIVLRSRYSPYFECWHYDIQVTDNESALYPKAHIQHGVVESELGRRL